MYWRIIRASMMVTPPPAPPDPPRVRPGLVVGQPLDDVMHAGQRPLQRPFLRDGVGQLVTVPGHPAAGRAEPGVLTARREHPSALGTAAVDHQPSLLVIWQPSRPTRAKRPVRAVEPEGR